MIKRLNHIGIVVKSIDETINQLASIFGAVEIGRKTIADRGQTSALVNIGDFKLELMEPYGEDGVVPKFLKNHGQGLHHISVTTDDLEDVDDKLMKNGVNSMGKTPKGSKEDRVIFTHPKQTNGIVFEIVEPYNG